MREGHPVGAGWVVVEGLVRSAELMAGRPKGSVQIIAVSKKQTPEAVSRVWTAGARIFGENYVQELVAKWDLCPGCEPIEWHYIGHLQSNKVKYIASRVAMIHTVDSMSLAEQIDKQAAKHDRVIPVLVQVNTSGEESKSGIRPEQVRGLIEQMSGLTHCRAEGLMTIPFNADEPEVARSEFRLLRHVRDSVQNEVGISLPHLSMGMSDDFDIAIEEGATFVRIGTAVFGQR